MVKNEKPARVSLSDVLAAISVDLVTARKRAESLAPDETYGLGVSEVEIELTTVADASTEGGGGAGVQMYVFTADLRGTRTRRRSDQQTVRVRLAPSRGDGQGSGEPGSQPESEARQQPGDLSGLVQVLGAARDLPRGPVGRIVARAEPITGSRRAPERGVQNRKKREMFKIEGKQREKRRK